MNAVIASGHLTADVETRAAGDHQVQQFTLAINQGDHATFLPIETWDMPHLERCLGKGSKVLIRGSLRQSNWETDDGQRRSRLFATAYEVEFLDRKADAKGSSSQKERTAHPSRQHHPDRRRTTRTPTR